MKTLKDIDVSNKSVVIRCDFNVPMEGNIIKDNSKIVKSLDTLKYLLDRNCKIVILSHLGRVKSEEDKSKNTLKYVGQELSNLLGREVKFVSKCNGAKVKEFVDSCNKGDVILLENTRLMDYPEKLESKNNEELAKFWASLGDVFVNDAFGSLHRAHASTAGIAKYIPHCIGFLVENELNNLDVLVHNTPDDFCVFMGGAKVDDKLPIIKSLLDRCRYLLVGGGIANSFLKARGADIGASIATSDESILEELKNLSQLTKKQIFNEYKKKYKPHPYYDSLKSLNYKDEYLINPQYEATQLTLTKSTGRIHGFFIGNIYYIRFLDRWHNMYDSEGYGGVKYFPKARTDFERLEEENNMQKQQIITLENKLEKNATILCDNCMECSKEVFKKFEL